jgi:hypothetical protein
VHLLSRGEEPHTKKSARVPNVEEPKYYGITFSPIDFKKRLSRRHRRKVPSFNSPRQGEKIHKKLHEVSKDYMGLQLCCLKFLALLQVWLCSRMSKSLSLGDVLALIKLRFHVPTCRVDA